MLCIVKSLEEICNPTFLLEIMLGTQGRQAIEQVKHFFSKLRLVGFHEQKIIFSKINGFVILLGAL